MFLKWVTLHRGNKSKNFAHGRFVENTIGNGIVSHVFDVFKPRMTNYDLQFWKYAINNERIMGPILLRSTKASTMMTNLVADDFLQENFLIPCYEEQKKIGEIVKAAIRGDERMQACDVEFGLPKPSYTYATLQLLKKKMAGGRVLL